MEEIHRQMQPPTDVRPQVAIFAQLMEQILRNNDYKGGWSECDLAWLVSKLGEELGEVAQASMELYRPNGELRRFNSVAEYNQALEQVIREAVDTANVAMMIADQCSRKMVLDVNYSNGIIISDNARQSV